MSAASTTSVSTFTTFCLSLFHLNETSYSLHFVHLVHLSISHIEIAVFFHSYLENLPKNYLAYYGELFGVLCVVSLIVFCSSGCQCPGEGNAICQEPPPWLPYLLSHQPWYRYACQCPHETTQRFSPQRLQGYLP